MSYADLDGQRSDEGEEEDEYEDEGAIMDEEDEFRPTKRTKGQRGGRKVSGTHAAQKVCPFTLALHLHHMVKYNVLTGVNLEPAQT